MSIRIPKPDLQVDFAASLLRLRDVCLLQALRKAAGEVDITALDVELARTAPKSGLACLAAAGLRGETVFCTPLLLRHNPSLLGYYRLLLGFSQKAFYTAATGLATFRPLEDGRMTNAATTQLQALCRGLNECAALLIESVAAPLITESSFSDLTLLTLGAQLRGGANVKKGAVGIERVFLAIDEIVGHAAETTTATRIQLKNSAGRRVLIEFAADPDIIIREELGEDASNFRNIIAIEIKAGTDFSNIHNRIGEAEKSHQKAKKAGYTECWTIVNVDNINRSAAALESPSTNRFYLLSDIERRTGASFDDFKLRILSLAGIADSKRRSSA
jgi:hypothetical protein